MNLSLKKWYLWFQNYSFFFGINATREANLILFYSTHLLSKIIFKTNFNSQFCLWTHNFISELKILSLNSKFWVCDQNLLNSLIRVLKLSKFNSQSCFWAQKFHVWTRNFIEFAIKVLRLKSNFWLWTCKSGFTIKFC